MKFWLVLSGIEVDMAGEDDWGEYDLAAGPDERRPPKAAPTPPTAAPGPAKPAPMLAYRGETNESVFSPESLIHRQAPMALLAGSLLVHFTAAWWDAPAGGVARAMGAIGMQLMASTALMLVCVFAASKARGFKLGPFPEAVVKLMAISVTPSATMMLLSLPLRFVLFGFLVGWGIAFCLYFALLGLFFELDQEDTWLCVIMIFVVQICVRVVMQFAV